MSPGPRGALAATGPDRAERIARTMNLWRWDSYTSEDSTCEARQGSGYHGQSSDRLDASWVRARPGRGTPGFGDGRDDQGSDPVAASGHCWA